MEITQEELKARLAESNDDFRRLVEQHAEYKKRVAYLENKPHPSEEELAEEAKLKKLKLQLKDRIAEFMSRHRGELASV